MSELKPCPFCGYSDGEIIEPYYEAARSVTYYVGCQTCDSRGPEMLTEEEAVEEWNCREGDDHE